MFLDTLIIQIYTISLTLMVLFINFTIFCLHNANVSLFNYYLKLCEGLIITCSSDYIKKHSDTLTKVMILLTVRYFLLKFDLEINSIL